MVENETKYTSKYPKEVIPALKRKTEAEADLAEAETRISKIQADRDGLILNKEIRIEADVLATDKFHLIYNFDDGIGPSSVKLCITQLTLWMRNNPKEDITIIFNSPGGSITDGFALFDFIQELKHKGHKVTTHALGVAASMAGVLLQAGDIRVMGSNTVLLIHEASFGTIGKFSEVEDMVDLVKKLQKRIVKIFTSRAHISPRKFESKWKRRDWWLTSEECLKFGFIDEIRGG